MLQTEIVRIDNYWKQIFEVGKRLDATNIEILSCMSDIGPRNLLEVSRRTGIPFTTVYHRVNKLESVLGRISHLVPSFSKLGLACLVVINNAKPGCEERLSTSLKMPNYWWSVTRCEGGFSHHSVHTVPVQHLSTFRQYLAQISRRGLVASSKVIPVGDYVTFDLNFDYYDPKKRIWRVSWDKWLHGLVKQKVVRRIVDPTEYPQIVDRRDLLIIKELQKNGRKTFAELAPMLGITLQGVKYRFDALTARGVCGNYWINVFPYPAEISAMYDVMVDFATRESMNRFYSFIGNLFFIISASKVIKKNSLLLRAYVLESQVSSMFQFLAELARKRMVVSYSALRLRLETRESQTISYELFEDDKRWIFDYQKCVAELRKI